MISFNKNLWGINLDCSASAPQVVRAQTGDFGLRRAGLNRDAASLSHRPHTSHTSPKGCGYAECRTPLDGIFSQRRYVSVGPAVLFHCELSKLADASLSLTNSLQSWFESRCRLRALSLPPAVRASDHLGATSLAVCARPMRLAAFSGRSFIMTSPLFKQGGRRLISHHR